MAINNKKSVKPIMNYLTVEEMKILLQQPDTTKPKGRRIWRYCHLCMIQRVECQK